MFAEGICLALIEEFDKALDGKSFSVLPLVRLCEVDDHIGQNLIENSSATHTALTALAERMLRRGADMAREGDEVITRPGVDVETVNSEGERVLCRPNNESRTQLTNAMNNKGVKVILLQIGDIILII